MFVQEFWGGNRILITLSCIPFPHFLCISTPDIPWVGFCFLQWFENISLQVRNQNILELDDLTNLGSKETRLSKLVVILKNTNEVFILKHSVH